MTRLTLFTSLYMELDMFTLCCWRPTSAGRPPHWVSIAFGARSSLFGLYHHRNVPFGPTVSRRWSGSLAKRSLVSDADWTGPLALTVTTSSQQHACLGTTVMLGIRLTPRRYLTLVSCCLMLVSRVCTTHIVMTVPPLMTDGRGAMRATFKGCCMVAPVIA
jgi:hypothetical protein